MLNRNNKLLIEDYITIQFESIIPCVSEDYFSAKKKTQSPHQLLPSPPLTSSDSTIIPLRSFIESIVTKSNTSTGTLISTLSYAKRLKNLLSRTSKGMECTRHRIFLATIIITTKYLHDSAIKNKYWVTYAEMFTAHEINLMEKQLLQLLDYNLEINDFDTIMDYIIQIYTKEYLYNSDYIKWNNIPSLVIYKEVLEEGV
ncbi:hypothetical protein G6F62_002415 [Rhizopus arrhizus]|nr:hypothetical protein G6F24_005092 [Rhizopus arrhizus]KAG0913061.1 hypothetical protein G6F33_005513 [Rhizopus arrhizus]KAG0952784.1 hypothetical protein G6F32_004433 [Rhizopus arrhizus]KAG1297329.1 hypothetical protein G6F66_002705 [Rhizopus arrhizus]KAG1353572.1 hypothetical protein G6F62_002415 [Rhizopus arrhizus]